MKKAKYYTKTALKNTPVFKAIMKTLDALISAQAKKGYTICPFFLNDVLEQLNLEVEEGKMNSVLNLVLKELNKNGFSYKINAQNQIAIYW